MKNLISGAKALVLSITVILLLGTLACQKDDQISVDMNSNASFTSTISAKATNTTVEDWGAVLRYNEANTDVRKAIVSTAISQIGKSSGQSVEGGTWYTDCYWDFNGKVRDGDAFRNAIKVYANWYNIPSNRPKNPCQSLNIPTTLKNDIIAALSATSYTKDHKTAIAEKIIARYNQISCANPKVPVVAPIDNNGTLAFLEIKKQCLEWAETVAKNSKGNYRGYQTGSEIKTPGDYRPGMGLYEYEYVTDKNGVKKMMGKHAMIIVDIKWKCTKDPSGKIISSAPTMLKVAEANYGSGWTNPNGQVMWARTIGSRNNLTVTSMRKVITYD